MILNREKLSMVLACMIYAASIFVSPDIHIQQDQTKTIQQINKSDSWQISGFTKNELNLLPAYQQACDLMTFPSVFLADTFIGLSLTATHAKTSVFYNILTVVQSGLQRLIFPHHTFW
jgi:hypothetical protein